MSVPGQHWSRGGGGTHIGEGEGNEDKLVEEGEAEVEDKVEREPVRRTLCERHLGGVHGGRGAVLRLLPRQRVEQRRRVPVLAPPRGGEVWGVVRAGLRRGGGRGGGGGGGVGGVALLRGHNPAARFVRLQADRGGHGERARRGRGAGGLCVGRAGRSERGQ